MTQKSTITRILLVPLCYFLLTVTIAQSQNYCAPVFSYGCYSWTNQNITLDSIHWVVDPYYCEISDYTALSTTLSAGTTYPMQVGNGNWCGCGVWIDFNQDEAFDTTENLFHSYQANEINSYNFGITVPANTPPGAYRMRVIAGWGTDCYTPSANGFGPCGIYQYGNHDDFTVHVSNIGTGVTDPRGTLSTFEVVPNPASTYARVTIKDGRSGILQVTSLLGQLIQTFTVSRENEMLDISSIPSGIYLLHFDDGMNRQSMKWLKE